MRHPNSGCGTPAEGKNVLLAKAGLYGDALAPLGAAARQDGLSTLGLHARPESVRLRPVTPIRLECALGHEKLLLLDSIKCLKVNKKYK